MALAQITVNNGTIVADPELRYTANGKAALNLRVATNKRRKNEQTGEWENSKSHFATFKAFDGLAENIAAAFSKGDKVNVIGELEQRQFETKEGQKRSVDEALILHVARPVSRFAESNNQQPVGNSWSSQPQGGFAGGDDEPPF